jgi:hypothetical protein
MCGRGLRSSPGTGKEDCYLLDFSGNIVRFAEDFTEGVFSTGSISSMMAKSSTKRSAGDEEHESQGMPTLWLPDPSTSAVWPAGLEKVSPSDSNRPFLGHMQEIFIGEGKNKKKLADNAEHSRNRLCSYARFHSQPDKQSGRAWHLFKKITGQGDSLVGSAEPLQWRSPRMCTTRSSNSICPIQPQRRGKLK